MTTFDNREKAFEAQYALDQDQEFRAQARRNRALGRWAGELMGLSGEALDAYAQTVVKSDFKEAGDEDVFQKVVADLAEKDVDILPHAVRERMNALLSEARAEIKAGQ